MIAMTFEEFFAEAQEIAFVTVGGRANMLR
jgi:hypothetical protein